MAGVALSALASGTALALPALQLGPGSGIWNYDPGTQTWFTSGPSANVNAFANAAIGGNGAYAWDAAGAANQYGYLIAAATPQGNVDPFDLNVSIGGTSLTLVSQGFGTPPLNDPNSIAPHGIFNTWFEVYEFQFNGTATTISDQQPGGTGTGQGFVENIDIAISNVSLGTTGVHFDLFTVAGDGMWTPDIPADRDLVKAVAPFSHDASYNLPEPGTLGLLGLGLVAAGLIRRRRPG